MTFADTYNLRADSVSFNDIANAADALLVVPSIITSATIINTTSTSAVDYTGISLSVTVASGEKVVLVSYASVSNSTSSAFVNLRIRRDSTDLGDLHGVFVDAASTLGFTKYITLLAIDTPTPGTYTYKLRWHVDTGTGYSARAALLALKVRAS